MKKQTRGSLILLVTALIWGMAFIAQSEGANYVRPFTYNTLRSVLGALTLIPVMFTFSKMNRSKADPDSGIALSGRQINVNSIKGGIASGFFLCIASALQQTGIGMTTAGKAGFITAIYIVIVPVLGIFLGKKTSLRIWLGVAVAVLGFYLLCINEGFSVSKGDLLVLGCAFVFSFQILTIDHFTAIGVDPVRMSFVQFLVVAVLSAVPMLLFEDISPGMIWQAKWAIAFAGIMSSGVAYTLQIFGQRDSDPAIATLIMSLESVFSALFGWLILHESMSAKELAGCALVFIAVILAQT